MADKPDYIGLQIMSLLSLEHKLANHIKQPGFWADETFAEAIVHAHRATRARQQRLNEMRMSSYENGQGERS